MNDVEHCSSRRRVDGDSAGEDAGEAFAAYLATGAEAIRAANRGSTSGFASLADCHAALSATADLTHRLPQALMHIAGSLRTAALRSFDDRGYRPAATIESAQDHLDQAAGALSTCAHGLLRAHSAVSHLGQVLEAEVHTD